MAEWIRVRDTSGHEISVRADVPDGHPRGVQEGQKRLQKAALAPSGAPLPPKYRTALGTPLPGSKTARKRTQTSEAKGLGENAGQQSAEPEKE